ncbi:MAG: cation-translocating P-type ATPase [Myxococcales bacterium]|nr:cation-translocating P-type ATPase [Myxococcales bacterium]
MNLSNHGPEASAGGQDAAGLTEEQVTHLRAEFGPNELQREVRTPAWVLLAAQFKSPVIGLLAGACAVSAALGEVLDAVAIGAIVVLNALVGFFQEYRAERAILALRSMTAPRARVVRDGRAAIVPAADVVPGDIIVLEAGDVVAADAELLAAHVLATNEASLTGESTPAAKNVGSLPEGTPLAERSDSVFMGTSVVRGTGTARVLATGMRTELGKIAGMLASVQDTTTPLQRRLARVSRVLLVACSGVVALVAVVGLLRGTAALEVFLSAVSLAVAAVPEGLPAVITIALAIGVQRMGARNVLVRRLPAVETLGCATVICTDKTGTLTTGVMTVRALHGPDEQRLLAAAAACCDAELATDGQGGVGDPTELALLAAAASHGVSRAVIEQGNPRVRVQPFDAERKRMSILRADGTLYLKGAVEVVVPRCSTGAAGALEEAAAMAGRGLRVLAVATGRGEAEDGLQLLGLVGMADPPRPEAIEAIARARSAGIRTVMITGDHPITARAIAGELGLLANGEDPAEVVHARATPEDKLRIIRDWKARGAVVAMTGDGVNDAPALREADVGVAMGKTGTEVTREAADVVLADDNFASIVAGVHEGRGIFDNIRKTLVYLLAGNAAELALMLLAAVLGLPLPLLPLALLWINLATDGLPALTLVMDPADPEALRRPPRHPDEPLLGRAEWISIAWTAALQTTVVLAVYIWALEARGLTEARNLAFTTLVFGELFRAFAARHPTRLFWEVGALTNLRLLAVVLGSAVLQIAIHHLPATQELFQIASITLADCAASVMLGLIPVTVLELNKLARRALQARRGVTR